MIYYQTKLVSGKLGIECVAWTEVNGQTLVAVEHCPDKQVLDDVIIEELTATINNKLKEITK